MILIEFIWGATCLGLCALVPRLFARLRRNAFGGWSSPMPARVTLLAAAMCKPMKVFHDGTKARQPATRAKGRKIHRRMRSQAAVLAGLTLTISACGSDSAATQFGDDAIQHGAPAAVVLTDKSGRNLGELACADMDNGTDPGLEAMQIANLKDGGLNILQSLVVVYWAAKDICPKHMDKVKDGWADDVHNPATPTTPTAPAPGPPTPVACDDQKWPQPVPNDVVGRTFTDAVINSSMTCFNIGSATTPDGRDLYNGNAGEAEGQKWEVVSISPPAGTFVGREEPIALTLIPLA